MNFSAHIRELLHNHDCVIVPGFGGFVGNYKGAEIHPTQYTVSPPCKAISFNSLLTHNDGLLVHHISLRESISFDEAAIAVKRFADESLEQLKNGAHILLDGIGRIFSDRERNFQFAPDGTINFLKSSFGLPVLVAQPIARARTLDNQNIPRAISAPVRVSPLRLAMILICLLGIGACVALMIADVSIRPLRLNEAGVFGFLNHWKLPENVSTELLPIFVDEADNTHLRDSLTQEYWEYVDTQTTIENGPLTAENTETEAQGADSKTQDQTAATNTPQSSIINQQSEDGYYVIIGAYLIDSNITKAQQRLRLKDSTLDVLTEKKVRLTKVGYYVGADFQSALDELYRARQEDSTYWLYKK